MNGAEPPPETLLIVYTIIWVDDAGKSVGSDSCRVVVKYADWVAKHGPLDDVDLATLQKFQYLKRTVELYDGIV